MTQSQPSLPGSCNRDTVVVAQLVAVFGQLVVVVGLIVAGYMQTQMHLPIHLLEMGRHMHLPVQLSALETHKHPYQAVGRNHAS